MKRLHPFSLLALTGLLLFACGNEKDPSASGRKGNPVVQVTADSIGNTFLRFKVELLHADKAWVTVLPEGGPTPESATVKAEGKAFSGGISRWEGLEPDTGYTLYACAQNGEDEPGTSVGVLPFKTLAGSLYDWEERRHDIPFFADLVLMYGSAGRTPKYWGKDRTRALVTWTDPDTGEERWLFDAFLVLEGRTDVYPPHTYMVGVRDWDDRSIGMTAANKADAEHFLDYWFSPGNGFPVLEELIGEAIGRIGPPVATHKVIVMMPDVPVHEHYNVSSSSTTYWGELNGRTLDFSHVEDRRQAYYWFVDETRRRFAEAGFRHIELGGFYIMTEELPNKRSGVGGNGGDRVNGELLDGWEVAAKGWDDVFPAVSEYIHQYHESVCWIPYRSAAGYRYWSEFGIDYAWMQPNYYWDTFGVNPISTFFGQIAAYNLGMELEFDDMMMPKPMDRNASEYTKTNNAGTQTITETYEDYVRRWRGYVDGMQNSPVYGVKPIAVYQDTDSFNHLRQSSYKVDNDAYHELARLVANDPLKQKNR